MPRHVDHDARRRQLAQAVCELIAEHGIEAVTLREVAARAGVSMGAVQRAFAKDGMLLFALEYVITRVTERGQQRIADSGSPESARTLLLTTLQEMTLADDDAIPARVWLTFAAQAAVRDDLATVLRDHHAKSMELLTWLIDYGQRVGEIRTDVTAASEAERLQTLLDGITLQIAVNTTTHRATRQLIDHATSHLWTPGPDN
jgi:AcrR family transcriptional regulator